VIAVTGASGFIGTALCDALAAKEVPLREVTRAGTAVTGGRRERAVITDLTASELRPAFDGAEVIVHLAGRAHRLRDEAGDPLSHFRPVNVEGSRAVVEAAAAAGVRRVLVSSSVKAVGEGNVAPWTEATPAAPCDAYGRSKLEAEAAALGAGRALGVEVVIMRFPMVYGPGAPANVRRLLALVSRGWPLPLGAISNRRSMLSLGNLSAAVDALVRAPGIGGQVFFVADGIDLSTPALIRAIAAGMDRPARLVAVPVGLLRALGRTGDAVNRFFPISVTSAEVERLTGSLTVSTERLRSLTGFRPIETPEAAWQATARWFVHQAR
jgi:UDP-N-acetyl-alpha-D-quinovosamine dehydrogenase